MDGSPATDWQPSALPARLVVAAARVRTDVSPAPLTWGHEWPPPPAPNVPPPPGTGDHVATDGVRRAGERGRHDVAHGGAGTHDVRAATDSVTFAPQRAAFVAVRVESATTRTPPMLEELVVTR